MNSIFNAVMGLFSKNLAIDLGTANSLVWMKGEGMVVYFPQPNRFGLNGGHIKVNILNIGLLIVARH